MKPYEVLSLLVQGGSGVVLFLTYRVIVRYTEETSKLAEAAVEQIPRPAIKLLPIPSVPMDGHGTPLGPVPQVTFKNAGSAAAHNIRYLFLPVGTLRHDMDGAVEAPILSPLEEHATKFPKTALTDPCGFIAEYESPGGARHRYRAVITGKSNIEGERYERVKGQQ